MSGTLLHNFGPVNEEKTKSKKKQITHFFIMEVRHKKYLESSRHRLIPHSPILSSRNSATVLGFPLKMRSESFPGCAHVESRAIYA